MIEDKVLILKFKFGSRTALQRIYEKYENYLLTVATGLLNDIGEAEDVLHDVFVKFAQSAEKLELNGSLKAYLATCVVNRVRDRIRSQRRRKTVRLDDVAPIPCESEGSDHSVIAGEELQRVNCYLAQLPYEQREAIMLRLHSGMKFKRIAQLQDVSENTVQGRYRYGLGKLRTLLNSEVKK